MQLGSKNQLNSYEMVQNSDNKKVILENTSKEKDLGVFLTDDLK